MSLQTIIDKASKIVFDRRRVVGQSVSRSQRVKTATRNSSQPWKLTVSPPPILSYADNRSTIEAIMTADRNTEQTIKLANNPRLNYLNEYQGDLTNLQLTALTITNFTSTTVTVGGLPNIGASAQVGLVSSSTVVFKPGDWIQPRDSRYPYIVTNTVTRGTGSVVTATVNRSLITSEATTVTTSMLVGTQTSLTVVVTQLPTYELGQWKRVNFSGDFELVEKII